jgi:DNA-binding NarL/FixJ family response regulator
MTQDPDSQKSSVFIVDDHPLVRESLTALINRQADLKVCGEADNLVDALRLIGVAKPQVAIVDISLAGGSGIQLIKNIKAGFLEVEVLVLSVHDEELYRDRAFRAGARGYVTKREACRDVLQGVRCVLAGKAYVTEIDPTATTADFVGMKTSATDSLVMTLSDRELEVFQLLGRGRSTGQIADELRISFRTVQAFCARVKKKLNLSSASQLTREATNWHDRQNRK